MFTDSGKQKIIIGFTVLMKVYHDLVAQNKRHWKYVLYIYINRLKLDMDRNMQSIIIHQRIDPASSRYRRYPIGNKNEIYP